MSCRVALTNRKLLARTVCLYSARTLAYSP